MRGGAQIGTGLLGLVIASALSLSYPCLAQQRPLTRVQQKHPAPVYKPATPAAPREQERQQPRAHAGDWLRRYKDVPPADQEQALQNDPQFRRLSPERQQQLRQRLQRFSTLPPQQQLRVLNRMETWEHLTREQKLQAREIFGQMQQLPAPRRRLVHTAIDDLRAMPPEQRDRVINSDRFKSQFSDQERDIMREATRLPLAPADEGDRGPESSPEN